MLGSARFGTVRLMLLVVNAGPCDLPRLHSPSPPKMEACSPEKGIIFLKRRKCHLPSVNFLGEMISFHGGGYI